MPDSPFNQRQSTTPTGNLTFEGASTCQTLWSGTPHNNSKAFVTTCWARWRPSGGDGSSTLDYKVFASEGTGRGGYSDVATQMTTRNDLVEPNAKLVYGWVPNGCCTSTQPGQTVTYSLSAAYAGVGTGVSISFQTQPDTVGQRAFSLAQAKHNYGWRGSSANVLLGHDGGFNMSYPQGGSWSANFSVYLQWS